MGVPLGECGNNTNWTDGLSGYVGARLGESIVSLGREFGEGEADYLTQRVIGRDTGQTFQGVSRSRTALFVIFVGLVWEP